MDLFETADRIGRMGAVIFAFFGSCCSSIDVDVQTALQKDRPSMILEHQLPFTAVGGGTRIADFGCCRKC